MKHYGLIGKSLSHSFSKDYFSKKFLKADIKAVYHLFELKDISELPHLLIQHPFLCGLNVTIPYKKSVIPFLDDLDETAKSTGAVNCIKIKRTGDSVILKGYNTDVYGFAQSIKPFLEGKHDRALILGTGGASLAVAHVLKKIGISCLFVSRSVQSTDTINYHDLNELAIAIHLLIVNTTPIGMYPDIDSFPNIPYDFISSNHFLCDLVYNPEETVFLRKGKEKGAMILNGLSMLHLQAEKSWEIWSSEE
jgi:shikimate dehydrogenase